MGIQGLSRLIADVAPGAVKENEIKNYFGEFDNVHLRSIPQFASICLNFFFIPNV